MRAFDEYDLFEKEEIDRRQRRRQEAIDFARQMAERDAKDRAEREIRAREFAKRASRELMLDEYRAAGVEPPLDGAGNPKCSLGLMKQSGWTIEDAPRGSKYPRVLIEPGWLKQQKGNRK